MHSRTVFIFCTLAIFVVLASSVLVMAADEHHSPRGRKLSNAPWLAAPHFQAFGKRGRFVFRDALDDYHHDWVHDDYDHHPEKRNWRL